MPEHHQDAFPYCPNYDEIRKSILILIRLWKHVVTTLQHGLDSRDLYVRSEHICKAIGPIKSRVKNRRRFRDLLFQAAQKASESGARATALFYYRSCMALLQADPWTEGPDKDYGETLGKCPSHHLLYQLTLHRNFYSVWRVLLLYWSY